MQLLSLGSRLRSARLRKKLTQSEVGKILQVSASTISKVESYNSIHWTIFKLIQLSSIYHTSLFDLITADHGDLIPICTGGTVVIIDDEQTQLNIYTAHLKQAFPDITVQPFYNSIRAEKWLRTNEARLVITDYRMPKLNGGNLLENLHQSPVNNNTPSILMTDKSETDMIRNIAKQENAMFFDKRQPKSVFVTLVSDILKIVK